MEALTRQRPLHAILLSVLPAAVLACATFIPVVPAFEWNRAADRGVISYGCYGGMMPQEALANDIPTYRLWGDGRALWVEQQSGGGRRVLTATLTDDQIKGLLTEMAQRRFFTMADSYEPSSTVYDGVACVMQVSLTDTTKSVTALTGGEPPDDYWTLASWLAGGGGVSGVDYIPEHGYLFATPVSSTPTPATHTWPAAGIDGVRLADAGGGLAVEGEALRAAWDIVNAGIYSAVESDGVVYHLAVQVEGVTSDWPNR